MRIITKLLTLLGEDSEKGQMWNKDVGRFMALYSCHAVHLLLPLMKSHEFGFSVGAVE